MGLNVMKCRSEKSEKERGMKKIANSDMCDHINSIERKIRMFSDTEESHQEKSSSQL